MKGKITDIGWYSPSVKQMLATGNTKVAHLPISYRGKSDKYNANRNFTRRYIDQEPDLMASLYEMLADYSLKGFEFGNWVTQEERNGFVPDIATTLKELSRLLGTRNIGFDHNIGIAFGARGNAGALAHYEPVLNMINLTRMKGAGSLAHEYGHALDFNFGSFLDQNKRYAALSGGRETSATLPDNTGGQLRALVNQIVDSICNGENYRRMKNAKTKDRTGKEVPLYNAYWFRRTELFARFFEQYICYLYKQKSITNRLLTKSWGWYTKDIVYVAEPDFLKIKPVADKLIIEMAAFLNNRKKTVSATPYPKPVIAPKVSPTRRVAAAKRVEKKAAAKALGNKAYPLPHIPQPKVSKPIDIVERRALKAVDMAKQFGLTRQNILDMKRFCGKETKPQRQCLNGIILDDKYLVASNARILGCIALSKRNTKAEHILYFPDGKLTKRNGENLTGKNADCYAMGGYPGWRGLFGSRLENYKLLKTCNIATWNKQISALDKGKKITSIDGQKFDIQQLLVVLKFLSGFNDNVSVYSFAGARNKYISYQLALCTEKAFALIIPVREDD